MHLKKIEIGQQLRAYKIVTNGHQQTKTTEDEKFTFCINAHTPVMPQFVVNGLICNTCYNL